MLVNVKAALLEMIDALISLLFVEFWNNPLQRRQFKNALRRQSILKVSVVKGALLSNIFNRVNKSGRLTKEFHDTVAIEEIDGRE